MSFSIARMPAAVKLQRNIAFLAIALFVIKILAWWFTRSVAVLTDAMESTVNVATGLIGWYSVWLAGKPRDKNHPYGHGKAEFVSAAIEGTLIAIAGIVIIYEAVTHLFRPYPITRLGSGLALLGITAVINYAAGTYAAHLGKKENSSALRASGSHLKTDTYSTLGIIAGLLLVKWIGWHWLDPVVAIIFALVILATGYRVLRSSLAGIMDEADMGLLGNLVAYLQTHRKPEWIDLHNLRMIQYGSVLHLDGHLTLPWYFTVRQAHHEIDELGILIREKFGDSVELFVHVDGCEPFSCSICNVGNCPERQHPKAENIAWTMDNVLENRKHHTDSNGNIVSGLSPL
ncbi:MAG: cation diffusion facilitator family transporter [Edaphocola sp.]